MPNIPRTKQMVIDNKYQGNATRVLCVCSGGVLRSPTAAWVLGNAPYNFNVRAAGLADYALIPVTDELIAWAEYIVVMDALQGRDITKMIDRVYGKEETWPLVVDFDIPDDFDFKDPELIRYIEIAAAKTWSNCEE